MKKEKKMNIKGLVIIIFLIVVISILGYFGFVKNKTSYNASIDGGYKMVITKNGFSPDTITIHKGDTITFSTNTKDFFWPASDVHPTHRIYPEFDPKQPIPPDQTWSFKFNKVGKWRCHDHLAPYFTCTITVLSN
jgi:plastocyanin